MRGSHPNKNSCFRNFGIITKRLRTKRFFKKMRTSRRKNRPVRILFSHVKKRARIDSKAIPKMPQAKQPQNLRSCEPYPALGSHLNFRKVLKYQEKSNFSPEVQ